MTHVVNAAAALATGAFMLYSLYWIGLLVGAALLDVAKFIYHH